ncbi:hypothetical protein HWD35_15105 [Tsukamurella tyrosinosolvens]|uniref:hypothetical protein n=1 Tax=Tsukamurella tyrosinosolvens TaxID=57704 RepID=UPI000793F8C9|nr:hypothetical protein [Tsukamurella tyrosinosolvens]AUN38807.1 hypothetical protein ASU32_01295 [Tsukamurella tyrosinosolvens]KXP08535.1 hypothetical protein AXK59_23555 [Tsukamurella tyrosinosolvens]KZL96202.1 hypothetical protein AXX05_11595 [Tsukamurella tyrosinosolvens]MCA4996044.1 hypothetical protein [Tsukamurella tyrosinosolvens]MEC4615179.1 hypothetical protein [Tsukamurella tyrosinosolvens]
MLTRATAALSCTATLAVLAPAVAHAAPTPGDEATARRIACEQYAVGAATFDYRDPAAWRARLVRGTSPELRTQLERSSGGIEQIQQNLKWVAKGRLSGSEVRHVGDDIWKAKCFVAIRSTTTKSPQGLDSVAVYNITIDKNRTWLITDIAGDNTGR